MQHILRGGVSSLGNTTNTDPLFQDPVYRRLVEHLIYLAIERPDICFAMHNPKISHMLAAERILGCANELLVWEFFCRFLVIFNFVLTVIRIGFMSHESQVYNWLYHQAWLLFHFLDDKETKSCFSFVR